MKEAMFTVKQAEVNTLNFSYFWTVNKDVLLSIIVRNIRNNKVKIFCQLILNSFRELK